MPPTPRNKWSDELDRKASTLSAAGMFGLFIVGQLLLIVSTIGGIGGLLMITGPADTEVETRIVGGVLILLAGAGFFVGAWASREFSSQSRM